MSESSPLRDHLRTLARYHGWATRKLYRSVDALAEADYRRDVGLVFKGVHGTLNHLLVAESIWGPRFSAGQSPVVPLDSEVEADRHALQERLSKAVQDWLPWLDSWPESRLLASLAYRRTDGQCRELPFAATLAHVFNHGTHHRGQVSAALTILGQAPPELDLVYMLHESQNT